MKSHLIFLVCTCVAAQGAWGQDVAASAKVEQAATTPLTDLNVVKQQIPAVLLQAQKAPYEVSSEAGCEVLAKQLVELESALPPDVDAVSEKDKSLAEDAAVAVVQGTVGGIIPFRSWVRKLTGAERRSKAVASAVAAGNARRSFLKGYALSKGCVVPKPEPAQTCTPANAAGECQEPAERAPAPPASSGGQRAP